MVVAMVWLCQLWHKTESWQLIWY